jgi:hypothetical protein
MKFIGPITDPRLIDPILSRLQASASPGRPPPPPARLQPPVPPLRFGKPRGVLGPRGFEPARL